MQGSTEKTVKYTRFYRKLHRWLAVPLLVFMFLIGFTGLLLGWKKQSGLLPPTAKGQTSQSAQWISLDSIQYIARQFAQDSLQQSDIIDRIDVRPQKGVAKIVFAEHFNELQIDCTTGAILSVNQRSSDIIEKIHDGSILDFWFQTNYEQAKVSYTSLISLGLIMLSFSGFWIWYNPKRIKKLKTNARPSQVPASRVLRKQ